MTTPNNDISRILDFWFKPDQDVKLWFVLSPDFDDQIKQNFGNLVEQACGSSLDHWSTDSPTGALALLILLDQFPRNIYRGHPNSYASDSKAVDIAIKAIARADDRKVEGMQPSFFYLPLMHDERLVSQIACVSLYEGLVGRCEEGKVMEFANTGLEMAKKHRDVIARFGRFPSRNGVLGRESTVEEKDFLERNPGGF